MDWSPARVLITLTLLLAIHFAAMADFYYKDEQTIVFNRKDDAIVSDPNTIELIGAAEFFSPMRARRCCQGIDSWFEPLLNL